MVTVSSGLQERGLQRREDAPSSVVTNSPVSVTSNSTPARSANASASVSSPRWK